MAKMYPNPVANFKNETEEKLYKLFQEKLGDSYIVLYGRSWTDHSPGSNPDPECDFIITKPGSGILIVEVKGGRWERKNGYWLCYSQQVKPSDNPFEQAKSNKSSLIKLLKSPLKWENIYFPVSYAIAFPETSFKSTDDLIGLPSILTFDELDYVENWIEESMDDCLKSNFPHKTDMVMVDYILQTLMKDYVIRLSDILNIDDKNLLVFTEQQMIVDKALKRKKRMTVEGCAGSGKTLMAIRQVKRLAKKGDVRNILFTCFNRELGLWLSKNTEELKNKCTTMPILDFFEKYAMEAGLINRQVNKDSNYYDDLPYYFLQANESLGLKYDAIVVDEGQSFKKDWWDILESLLEDDNKSYLYNFYDDFQRIYQEVKNRVPGDDQPFTLYYNVRNTVKIHKQATKFLPKENLPECNNILGESIWLHFYSDDKSMRGALRKVFRLLIQEGGVSSKDIIILTPQKTKSILPLKEKLGPYNLVTLESTNPSAIRYSTIQSFRGMERKVVIMTELDSNVKELIPLIYMGCSRAKTKLVMLVSNNLDNKLKENILQGCEDITGWS